MSDTKVKISELPSVSEVLGTDESPAVQSSTTKKFTMTQLGSYILGAFSGLSLGGIAQTVKSAIDSIATLLGNSSMGTTATTVTGAIAEHESDITSLNNNLNFAIDTKSASTYTVAANSGAYADIDVTKSGYHPIAILGFDTQNTNALFISIRFLSTTTARVWVRNVSGSSITVTPTLTILYKPV